jgi:hypothetical protein
LQIVLFLDRLSTPNPARIAIICPPGTPAISAALPREAVTVHQSFLAAPKQNGQSSREFKFQQFAGVDPVLSSIPASCAFSLRASASLQQGLTRFNPVTGQKRFNRTLTYR